MGIFRGLIRLWPLAAPVAKAVNKTLNDRKKSAEQRHIELLEQLNKQLEKQNSKWETFKLGLMRGAATAIGATIIAAAALTMLMQVIQTVDDVPIIRDIIEETNVKEAVKGNNITP